MKTRLCRLLVLALLCLLPSVALADGVSPVLNLFHRETWLPASFVTAVIILVESLLLRFGIKQVGYFGTLWRCTLLNLASSLVGSVLLLGLGRDSFFVWDTYSLVLPLFLITVATEIPLLWLLYKRVPLSWPKASALGFGINVVSYAVVFLVEIVWVIVGLGFADRTDQKELSEWVHPELLAQTVGQIYATEETPAHAHGLRVLDVKTKAWRSLTNCPSIDPGKWDVEGHTCVFVRSSSTSSEKQAVEVASLPDFSPLSQISLSTLAPPQHDSNSGWQGISDLALSPDAKKVAVLFRVADAVAYRNSSSFFDLGGRCVLAVFAVDSGKQITRASRWASDRGLCWFPDSSSVLFTSFRDEGVYKTTKAEVRGDTSYGVGYAKGDQFKMGLFAFNITTGEIHWFGEGEQPTVSLGRRQFIIRNGYKARLVETNGMTGADINVPRIGYSSPVLSPCGKLLLAEVRRHQPFYGSGRLVVIDSDQPALRHIIANDLVYRFKWTASGEESSTGGTRSLP